MSKHLVIVESPAKSKTIEKYLGGDYKVMASYGHVRDLVPKEGAVNPDDNFHMTYQVVERNEKHVQSIERILKKSDTLVLATDPDREGEAISWHLVELLREKGALEGKQVKRVVFYEITKRAITEAIDNARELSFDMVDAQQTRRALDYLVGFHLSPLLWQKIHRGLSAGRVQSPALRMIAEREDEIEAFIPREYWQVYTDLVHQAHAFRANLRILSGEKQSQFSITDAEAAAASKALLEQSAKGELSVIEVIKKQRKRSPSPPFTTSTMQQEGVRKLGFSSQRTMRVAQQLYEGIKTDEGQVGLITYMRTDSVNLAAEAIADIRAQISSQYGPDNVPEKPNYFKSKSKNTQEAHEAIRPTGANRTPAKMQQYLNEDQYKLYNLIWKRTIASQMIHAIINMVSIDFAAGSPEHQFRATGSTIGIAGFMQVYLEEGSDKQESMLPAFESGDRVALAEVSTSQHFTEPPPRYTEASLIKTLEEYGIGRPSTYASIVSTLQARGYVELEQRRFTPTDTGRVTNRFLSEHFSQYVDYDFTSKLEDKLDAIARGERPWLPVIGDFWTPFKALIEEKKESVSRDDAMHSRELGTDPASGKPISVRIGRFGPYVQIGTRHDEEKPKFAGLAPGMKMNTVTLEDALKLFRLPRDLGLSELGEKISVSIGRFGPYIKYDAKYLSLKDEDPYSITLERACELVVEKKVADANKIIRHFEGTDIQVLQGRWGPYVTDGDKNAKIPPELKETPEVISLEQATEWLEKAPARRKPLRAAKKAAPKKAAAKKAAPKKASTGTAPRKTVAKKKTAVKKGTKPSAS